MRIVPCEQGSQAWVDARLGIPTASNFHKILTPKKMVLSDQRHALKHRLLAEWLVGMSFDDDYSSPAIERGSALEQKARGWYAFERKVCVTEAGLCLRDDGLVGCSPDGLVGDDGGLEIKCPMAPKCVAYMLDSHVEEDHKLQIHGALYVTGRQWWDVLAWNPYLEGFPPSIVRVHRDEAIIKQIDEALSIFLSEIQAAKEHLLGLGCIPMLKEIPF